MSSNRSMFGGVFAELSHTKVYVHAVKFELQSICSWCIRYWIYVSFLQSIFSNRSAETESGCSAFYVLEYSFSRPQSDNLLSRLERCIWPRSLPSPAHAGYLSDLTKEGVTATFGWSWDSSWGHCPVHPNVMTTPVLLKYSWVRGKTPSKRINNNSKLRFLVIYGIQYAQTFSTIKHPPWVTLFPHGTVLYIHSTSIWTLISIEAAA